MSNFVARKEVALVFVLSLGIATGWPLLMAVSVGVAPLLVGLLLLRRLLLVERVTARDLMLQGGGLWFALNVAPAVLVAIASAPLAMFPAVLKSFLWMMILMVAIRAGAHLAPRGSASRLLGILAAAFGLVLTAALLLAPAGKTVACPGGACLKPIVGFSVPLLGTIERGDIVVHVPALPDASDAP